MSQELEAGQVRIVRTAVPIYSAYVVDWHQTEWLKADWLKLGEKIIIRTRYQDIEYWQICQIDGTIWLALGYRLKLGTDLI